MLGRFSVGKWTRGFSSFGMFAGEKFMLQNRSCSCPTVVEFMTENWPRGREPTENKIVGDDTRKLLTEQFSPLIDGLVGVLHIFGGIPVIWRRFVVQINILAREWTCWTTRNQVRELCVLNLLQIKMNWDHIIEECLSRILYYEKNFSMGSVGIRNQQNNYSICLWRKTIKCSWHIPNWSSI